MTVQQILVDVYEQSGNISDLNVYQADGTTFDIATSGSVKLLQKLNEAQNAIASWKDPTTGYHLRMHNYIGTGNFYTWAIDDVITEVGNTTFPYYIALNNTSTQLSTTTGTHNDWIVELTSGSGSGEIRLVTSHVYVGGVNYFYIHDAFDVDPAIADTVKLYRRWVHISPAGSSYRVSGDLTLPSETDTMNLTGNLVEILKLEDIEEQKELVKSERAEGFTSFIESYGDATEWYRLGNKIYFDVNQRDKKWFKYEYYRLPTALTTASQEPEIPLMFHQGIVLWMLEWAYRRQQEFTAAYSMNQRLIQFLREQKSQYDVMGYRSNSYGTLRKE